MPATLTAPHAAVSRPVSRPLSVGDLSNCERALALYASDMPTEYRQKGRDYTSLCAWIIQGATRLGLAELYRSASYAYGYRLLCLADLATPAQTRTHEVRFPDSVRLEKAESLGTLITCFADVGMTEAALERASQPEVEGNCRCRTSGWIREREDPNDPSTVYAISCPVHNPNAIGNPFPVKVVLV